MSPFYQCPKTLWKTEFKDDRLINLAEEISRQPSIQVVAGLLLADFSFSAQFT
jgi:hypothetical protein